ncbi:MAG: DUF1232 domain-containing protein [Chloroflexota bacterium]|nr:MAG: DUF1232 domain-containing protein [Chloroflexota bacterium]
MAKSNQNNSEENQNQDMSTSLPTTTTDEGFWREMWRQARLAWFLIRSPEVPLYLKVLPALAVVYVLIPTDFIPDVFPVIGQLDDVTALLVGAKVFIEMAPQDVVAKYVQAQRESSAPPATDEGGAAGEQQDEPENLIVIEGDYDVVDDLAEDQTD